MSNAHWYANFGLMERSAEETDLNYIRDSFYKETHAAHFYMDDTEFKKWIFKPFEALIKRFPPSILCPPAFPDQIGAWYIHKEPTLFYLFVRGERRKQGLGRTICMNLGMASVVTRVAYLTEDLTKFLRKIGCRYVAAPYATPAVEPESTPSTQTHKKGK